ncbi:MAG: butyryl-CoA:acetate CoA-transferase [Eubacteriales bacterium]
MDKMYQEKLGTPEKAAALVNSGDWVDYGFCAGTPVAVDKALAARVPELHDLKFRGGILMWQPEILKVPNPENHLIWNSWHSGGFERKLCATDIGFYIPLRYSELPRWYREDCQVDVAIFQVAPMDQYGFFNFGPSNTHMKAVCEVARQIVVEVNPNLPYCNGVKEQGVHISDVTMIVEGTNPPMAELGAAPAGDVDKAVAKLIVEEIPNGACLQLGIGGMPGAVGTMIAESDLKDLGVHTEMYVDAFVDIAMAGKINGKCKQVDPGKQVFAFAAGTKKLYDYIHKNPQVLSAPVNYTNDARIIAQQDNFISINNAVDVDLFGQINSESAGTRHISGAGGQLDFVLGAYLSNGGKTFICCSSSFTDKNGQLHSRIRPQLASGSAVTDTRTNVQYVVTEYGKVNLKGKATWQRAEMLIGIAHPSFRDELIIEAEKMGVWKKSNKR